MKKVLILGATGFIGRNLLEKLAQRDDLDITATRYLRPEYKVLNAKNLIKWKKIDLRNEKDVSGICKGVDVVIQAAATTSGSKDIVNKPYLHVTDNAVMNSYLLRDAYENEVDHFIFFSCTVMYPSSDLPIKEKDWNEACEINPKYFGVAKTKIYIENMLKFYSGISNMKTTAIRHSNIYGPYDKYDLDKSHVFGATITKVMNAKESIDVWGAGNEERDLLYVDDLVEFVEAALLNQKSPCEIYNCGSGVKISIKDLVDKIVKVSGKSITIKHDLSKPSIYTKVVLDSKKALDDLGWKPTTTLDSGIEKTITWWEANIRRNE